nr:ribonuclease H-like domain-containing protein [Tanacetum cinerariifolium]
MDDPNITMEEYIRLEEEKARRRGKVYNWETATYDKIWYDKDVHDLRSVETEFSTIVFNDSLTFEETPFCEPNDNDKVNMPSFPSPEPTVSYFDDLDFFKDFENEFLAIVYNDALTSKSDFLPEPTISIQHINEFNLKDETSLSECDEEEQNVLYFNDLFPFNVMYPDDSKLDKDNDDDDKIDIKQPLGVMTYSLNEYNVFDTGLNTAYPGEWIRRIEFLYGFRKNSCIFTTNVVIVIESGDSYKDPLDETGKGPTSESSAKKKGRTVVITTEDMQKRRTDVKARKTLLLALPDEHQLRFSKYETAKELWEAILKTFSGNEATKKIKKNQLKQQYGNFKAEGSETLEQTFNRMQAIVSHLKFIDVEIKQAYLNQKFLTSLAPEWLMYTIVWRNRDNLDTMSLDDVYNHLKVYEPEVQKKSESSSQNMAFISSSNTSSRKENHALVADDEVPTEFALMAKSSSCSENEAEARLDEFKEQEIKFCEKIRGLERDVEVRNNKIKYLMNELKQVKKEKEGSIMSKPMIKFVKAADSPRVTKTNNTENSRKSTIKYAEMYRNTTKSPKVRGNQRNWNNLKSQQLGKDFLMQNKACFKCGYFDHLASDCGIWVEKGKTWPKNNFAHKRMTPKAVLLKSGTTPITVSRPNMNVAQPKMISFTKTTHSNVTRTFQRKSAVKNQFRVQRVSTADLKFPTAKSTFTADLGNKGKAVKALACWIWRPKQNTSKKGPNCNGNPQNNIDDKGYWDSGCSRHMTGNLS